MLASHLNKLVKPNLNSNQTILIYCEVNSNRLNYVCRFIFNTVLKINFEITNDLLFFESYAHFKINYSKQTLSCFSIYPHDFLIDLKPGVDIESATFKKNNQLYFCKTNCNLGFDIFSAVFACISRIEEWGNYKEDKHHRFEAKESIFYKHDCLLQPIVDNWINELRDELLKQYSELNFDKKELIKVSTIDIDNLYAFKNKGVIRSLGGFFKDIFQGRVNYTIERIKVIFGKDDPFDVYTKLNKYHSEKNTLLVYFFLLNTNTEFDRTVNPNHFSFKKIISQIIDSQHTVGLHPSYYSSSNENQLKEEINLISKYLDEAVTISRQHYLKFNIKTTPKLLFQNGIMVDFTMGFASMAGFRAGTSHPFHYFDFNTNSELQIVAFPFCLMDGAYTVYNNKATSIKTDIDNILNNLKSTGGLFTTVFHERTFSELHFGNFSKVYWDIH